MQKVQILRKTTNDLPKQATLGSAGFDFRADLWEIKEKFLFNSYVVRDQEQNIKAIAIMPGGRALIPTGIYLGMPKGIYMELFDRSGQAIKQGIIASTGTSVIDQDYYQEVGIPLTNMGNEPFFVCQGDRIAQGIFKKMLDIEFEEVEVLDVETTDRTGGFGSTNISKDTTDMVSSESFKDSEN